MPQLQVGNVIYRKIYGRLIDRLTIDRVSPKMAFSGSLKFKIEYIDVNYSLNQIGGASTWNSNYYYLETEKLKSEWDCVTLIKKIENIKFSKLPLEQLQAIHDIVYNKNT